MIISGSDKIRILNKHLKQMPDDLITEVITCFPFENMISVNILDQDLISDYTEFLKQLSNYDYFFQHTQAIKRSLEFIWSTLFLMKNLDKENILLNLLQLLNVLLLRIKEFSLLNEFIWENTNTLTESIHCIIKLKTFNSTHIGESAKIICTLIDFNKIIRPEISKLALEGVKTFIQMSAIQEVADLCRCIIIRSNTLEEIPDICIVWLLSEGISYIKQELPNETLLALADGISKIYIQSNCLEYFKKNQVYYENVKQYVTYLPKISGILIEIYINKPLLKYEISKLLAIAISEYVNENYDDILPRFIALPEDFESWPSTKSEVFFYICSLLCQYSRPLWSSACILQSISSYIYSYNKFSISTSILKSLCHLYPIILIYQPINKKNMILGVDLTNMMKRNLSKLSIIFTCHEAQFIWVLQHGDQKLVTYMVYHWLTEGNIEILRKFVNNNKVQNIVVKLLLNELTDDSIIVKCVEFISKIDDFQFLTNISKVLARNYKNIWLFNIMLKCIYNLCNIPCDFLILLLFFVEDEDILKKMCNYFNNFITQYRNDSQILDLFYKDKRIIKHLLFKMKTAQEETSLEILGLLKKMLLVQKRNHTYIQEQVDVDVLKLFTSMQNAEKCLEMLQLILSSNKLFLKFGKNKQNITQLFMKLLDISTRYPNLSVRSFICLTNILMQNPFLAYHVNTQLFIKIQCTLEIQNSWPEFIMFLSYWIKILKKNGRENKIFLVRFVNIANYLQRINFLPQNKVQNILKNLEVLQKVFNN